MLLNIGNYYTKINDFKKSEQNLFECLNIVKKKSDDKMYAYINLIALYKKQKKYNLALQYIDSALTNQSKIYIPKFLRLVYANQADIYEELGQTKKMKEADLLYQKLDSLIDDFHRNSNFYEIDTKYQTAQKDIQISYLKSKYNQNKVLYLSLIFLVFLLALYSFVRWKKEDCKRKKEQLEKQSIETMYQNTAEELQKTKQLVIEDYIVLKNNAKIYLEELIYIKSEDHYLELITTHKKEFVRGKMSEIIQQLPPNFQKCHRSYIVNINYITTYLKTEVKMKNGSLIPISRGFKFEE